MTVLPSLPGQRQLPSPDSLQIAALLRRDDFRNKPGEKPIDSARGLSISPCL